MNPILQQTFCPWAKLLPYVSTTDGKSSLAQTTSVLSVYNMPDSVCVRASVLGSLVQTGSSLFVVVLWPCCTKPLVKTEGFCFV